MTINGVELDIDFTDAEILEKVEKASKEVYDEAEKIQQEKNLSVAEGIRQECKMLDKFLDCVIGEENRNKLNLGTSLKKHLKAFEDIVEAKEEQYNEIQNRVSKYSPERLER